MQLTQREPRAKYSALVSKHNGQRKDFFYSHLQCKTFAAPVFLRSDRASKETPESKDRDTDDNNSLDDAARAEHEYLRQRLRDELRREPTEEEMNEWLRNHTEGY